MPAKEPEISQFSIRILWLPVKALVIYTTASPTPLPRQVTLRSVSNEELLENITVLPRLPVELFISVRLLPPVFNPSMTMLLANASPMIQPEMVLVMVREPEGMIRRIFQFRPNSNDPPGSSGISLVMVTVMLFPV